MSWTEFHKASEAAAIEAEQLFRDGSTSDAVRFYAKAAELEEQAFADVDGAKVRTRGITAVSAVSLWYKAASYERAEQLAHSMLADVSLPQFARTDLRNLVQAIWTEISKQGATVNFLPGQVFVSVKGGEVITGGAPLDLIVEKVQTIQAMFYRTVEFIRDMPLRSRGGPIREIQELCRPWLFQALPGSYVPSSNSPSRTSTSLSFKDARALLPVFGGSGESSFLLNSLWKSISMTLEV
jgi:hypothetical protein